MAFEPSPIQAGTEPERKESPLDKLSDRERQILTMAAKGLTDQAIANNIGISLGTIGTYWGRIRGKLGHFNRTELVAQFLKRKASDAIDQLKADYRSLESEIQAEREKLTDLAEQTRVLTTIINAIPEAIIVADDKGRVSLANQEAADLFEYGLEELKGKRISDLMPARYRAAHDSHRNDYLATPEKKKMGEHLATLALTGEGREFPAAVSLSPTRTDTGLLVTCIIRDLTKN